MDQILPESTSLTNEGNIYILTVLNAEFTYNGILGIP